MKRNTGARKFTFTFNGFIAKSGIVCCLMFIWILLAHNIQYHLLFVTITFEFMVYSSLSLESSKKSSLILLLRFQKHFAWIQFFIDTQTYNVYA